MGTGFGGVPFDEAARQMAGTYRHCRELLHGWTGTSWSSGTGPCATTRGRQVVP
jgi:hypothetical protein